jgi:hypothetical protein
MAGERTSQDRVVGASIIGVEYVRYPRILDRSPRPGIGWARRLARAAPRGRCELSRPVVPVGRGPLKA